MKEIFKFSLKLCGLLGWLLPLPSAFPKEGKLIPFHLQQGKAGAMSPAQLEQATEAALFDLTNQERRAKGLPTLASDSLLQKVAREHSSDMLKRNYLSHFSPEKKSVFDRVTKNVGKVQTSLGENLHTIQSANGLTDPQAIAQTMMQDWMGSSSHRVNIVSKKFRFMGVGCSSDGMKIYCTQDFSGDPLAH